MRKLLSNIFTLLLVGIAAALAFSLYVAPQGTEVNSLVESFDAALEPEPETATTSAEPLPPEISDDTTNQAANGASGETPSVAGLAVAIAGPDDVEISQSNRVVGPEVAIELAESGEATVSPPTSLSADQAQTGPPVADPVGPSTTGVTQPETAPTSANRVDAVTSASSPDPIVPPVETVQGSLLTELELEIVRLTNEIRTNPNGPLARQGPFIDCGGRIAVDRAAGTYVPVPALTVHEEASVRVARAWSQELTTDLKHREEAGVGALSSIGLNVVRAGENVSYNNFDDVVRQHVEGWRESDGHFCNLMSPRFTHIAVGEWTNERGMSFASQNFFALG